MVSGVSGSSGSNSSNALTSALAASTNNNQFVSQNTFLTLLITQLQNQDPMNPQDSSQFVAQLAQFSSLEQMTQLNQSFSNVLDNSAASLIGQTVTVADQNSQSGFTTGQVTGIVYYANGPAVQVNGVNYPLSSIQNVGNITPNAPTGG
jgi:flagellar basal-body rod modification protein FlgD